MLNDRCGSSMFVKCGVLPELGEKVCVVRAKLGQLIGESMNDVGERRRLSGPEPDFQAQQ